MGGVTARQPVTHARRERRRRWVPTTQKPCPQTRTNGSAGARARAGGGCTCAGRSGRRNVPPGAATRTLQTRRPCQPHGQPTSTAEPSAEPTAEPSTGGAAAPLPGPAGLTAGLGRWPRRAPWPASCAAPRTSRSPPSPARSRAALPPAEPLGARRSRDGSGRWPRPPPPR